MRVAYIYGLYEPGTNSIRYVGKADNVEGRYKTHLHEARWPGPLSKKNAWIKSLLDRGLAPDVRLIEMVDYDEWPEAERFWIVFYRIVGYDLLNTARGGDSRHAKSVRNEDRMRALEAMSSALFAS